MNKLLRKGQGYVLLLSFILFSFHSSFAQTITVSGGCDIANDTYSKGVPQNGKNLYQRGQCLIRWSGSEWEIALPIASPTPLYTAPGDASLDPPSSGWTATGALGCTGTVAVSFGALPVEFTFFRAENIDNNPMLFWGTASENNNLGFEVQRSRNAKVWTVLDFVDGKGTTDQEAVYQYTDTQAQEGIFYYRLLQQDIDGQFEYSDITSVDLGRFKQEKLELFPNPATNYINFPPTTGRLTILNQIGQAVKQIQLKDNNSKADISELRAGLYFVEILTPNRVRYLGQFIK